MASGIWVLLPTKAIKGRDGVVRAVQLGAGKSYLERAVQQLCLLELECDDPLAEKPSVTSNATVKEFGPKRKAVKEAEKRTQNIAEIDYYSCSHLISQNQIGGECWDLIALSTV